MKITIHNGSRDNFRFALTGTCPHCGMPSVFTMPAESRSYSEQRWLDRNTRLHVFAMMECSGCYGFILGTIVAYGDRWQYHVHYPVGRPSDAVSEDVKEPMRSDFREALRCRWVDAYNATVEMCRRALEASCLDLGAPEKLGSLQKMIDWVAEQGKITKPLQEMAHKVRLGGDRGAHPSTRIMNDADADAVIEFTREYFDHVYVMPAKMAKFNFDRPKPEKKTP